MPRSPFRHLLWPLGLGALCLWPLLSGTLASVTATEAAPADPASGPPVGGEDVFRCLGVGSRKTFGFKVYAVTFCLKSEAAVRVVREYAAATHPGRQGRDLERALATDQRFFDTLVSAPGDKLLQLRFQRNIGRRQLGDAFRDSLVKVMPRASAEKLVQALSVDVRKGEVAQLRSRGGDLVMTLQGREVVIEDDPYVTGRLWEVWLGEESPTPNLKASIASGAPQLL